MRTKINKHHQALLEQIERDAKIQPFESKLDASYDGHNEKTYKLSNPQLRKIVKNWLSKNKNITIKDFLDLLDSVYTKSESSTEKYLGGFLIEYIPELRNQIQPNLLDKWLDNLNGWAQIDSLCQSKFSSTDLQNNWSAWKKTIMQFNKSDNINKRRASLVLLTRSVRESENNDFVQLAFENINNLKDEKDILITKAVSWLLREMIKLHKDKVKQYLLANETTLPKIAVRETKRKLETGKKWSILIKRLVFHSSTYWD